MSRNFTVLSKLGLDPLATPDAAPAVTEETAEYPKGYAELLRRLFYRPSVVAVTTSGTDAVQVDVCAGIAAELAASGKQVVVVPVDRLLLMNPIRVIDDISLLPGVSPNVWVWPSISQQMAVFGNQPINAGESWLDRLRRTFYTVILDCPPIEAMPGVTEIAAMVDATVLVVEAGRTTKQQIRKDQLALQLKGATIAGCVLVQGRE
jgi:Mrp family chromosome partitioning ATPase